MRFVVTSYLQVSPFLGALEQSLKDMRAALESAPPPPPSEEGNRKRR